MPFQSMFTNYWSVLNSNISSVFESNWETSIICYFGPLAWPCAITPQALESECFRLEETMEIMIREHIRGLASLSLGLRVSKLGREALNASSAD